MPCTSLSESNVMTVMARRKSFLVLYEKSALADGSFRRSLTSLLAR